MSGAATLLDSLALRFALPGSTPAPLHRRWRVHDSAQSSEPFERNGDYTDGIPLNTQPMRHFRWQEPDPNKRKLYMASGNEIRYIDLARNGMLEIWDRPELFDYCPTASSAARGASIGAMDVFVCGVCKPSGKHPENINGSHLVSAQHQQKKAWFDAMTRAQKDNILRAFHELHRSKHPYHPLECYEVE